jgi:hypothetical protein
MRLIFGAQIMTHLTEGGLSPQGLRSVWQQLIANPVTLGAVITAYVTLNTAIFGYLSTRNSQHIERDRFEFEASLEERKYETGLILEIAKSASGDQQILVHRLCILAEAGLIPTTAERMRQQANSPCSAAGKP